jgi:MSHA pilin protein MshD
LIIFIVVVSIGLTGVMIAFNQTVKFSSDPALEKQAQLIAEATLNEILQKDFQNDIADPTNTSTTLGCTPSTTPSCNSNSWTDRQNYNDVDDFIGFSKTGLMQLDGITPIVGFAAYTLTVGVVKTALSGIPSADSKLITVTITGNGHTATLTGYRTNYD